MSSILQIINKLRENLFAKYGNPLANYKQTQDDVHDTYYVGRLMEELGHKWISPGQIKGEHEDRAYYSERALHDAFLAGRLLSQAETKKLRASLIAEIRAEMINAVENLEIQ